MSKYAIKYKGRGFLAGFKLSSRYVHYTEEEKKANVITNGHNSWEPSGHWVSDKKIIFKRNLSDVDAQFIKDSYKDCKEIITTMQEEGVALLIQNLELLDNVKIVSIDDGMIEKRVLNSKKKHYYTQDLVRLHKTNQTNPIYCNHCGTNIYKDEPFLRSNTAIVCVHCLSGLAKDITEAYDKLPEKNKNDYLLARAVDI